MIYSIAIQAGTARNKEIREGDEVWVETIKGRRVKGRIHLTEAIHPEGLGIAACSGHWADTLPITKGKGVFFNELLEMDFAHASPANLNLDLCAKVKVVRCDGER